MSDPADLTPYTQDPLSEPSVTPLLVEIMSAIDSLAGVVLGTNTALFTQ